MALKKPVKKTTKTTKKPTPKKAKTKKEIDNKNMSIAKALAESALEEVSKKEYKEPVSKPTSNKKTNEPEPSIVQEAKPSQLKHDTEKQIGSSGKLAPEDIRRLRSKAQSVPLVPNVAKETLENEFPTTGSKLSPEDVRKLRELNAPKNPTIPRFVLKNA